MARSSKQLKPVWPAQPPLRNSHRLHGFHPCHTLEQIPFALTPLLSLDASRTSSGLRRTHAPTPTLLRYEDFVRAVWCVTIRRERKPFGNSL